MGRMKKADKQKVNKGLEDTRKLMSDVQTNNGVSVNDILSVMGDNPLSPANSEVFQYIPIHSLKKIKEQLGQKVKKVDEETGKDIFVPLYQEEEKAKIMFGLLAERGINLLDHLDDCLAEAGYSADIVTSITDTVGRVSETLRDIGEIQFRKAKLENERTNLEIQKYKADLKKRELDIKEREADNKPTGNNIIAVGSTRELLDLINGNKNHDEIKEINVENSDE